MSDIPPLEYRELIAPERRFGRILLPNEIPIHSAVYDSNFAYTPEFLREVIKSLPDSMRQDLSEIERILGTATGLKIVDAGLVDGNDEVLYSDILHTRDRLKKSVGVELGSANIDLNRIVSRTLDIFVERAQMQHPMSLDKLRAYAFEPDEVRYGGVEVVHCHTWYVHNYLDHGMPLAHYFRNFAIMFNNLGIKRL